MQLSDGVGTGDSEKLLTTDRNAKAGTIFSTGKDYMKPTRYWTILSSDRSFARAAH